MNTYGQITPRRTIVCESPIHSVIGRRPNAPFHTLEGVDFCEACLTLLLSQRFNKSTKITYRGRASGAREIARFPRCVRDHGGGAARAVFQVKGPADWESLCLDCAKSELVGKWGHVRALAPGPDAPLP